MAFVVLTNELSVYTVLTRICGDTPFGNTIKGSNITKFCTFLEK